MRFNHYDMLISKFKERYKKRIDNLYNQLQNEAVHIYFIVATFNPISDSKIEQFINEINYYRKIDTYDLIIINQAKECFVSKNKKGNWTGKLKK